MLLLVLNVSDVRLFIDRVQVLVLVLVLGVNDGVCLFICRAHEGNFWEI